MPHFPSLSTGAICQYPLRRRNARVYHRGTLKLRRNFREDFPFGRAADDFCVKNASQEFRPGKELGPGQELAGGRSADGF